MSVPKPPAFDGKNFGKALTDRVRKEDGSAYQVFDQFAGWKIWNDKQRDVVETHRVQLADHKKDLDSHSASVQDLRARVSALEAQPHAPFPGSG
jgi:hypothetical protein